MSLRALGGFIGDNEFLGMHNPLWRTIRRRKSGFEWEETAQRRRRKRVAGGLYLKDLVQVEICYHQPIFSCLIEFADSMKFMGEWAISNSNYILWSHHPSGRSFRTGVGWESLPRNYLNRGSKELFCGPHNCQIPSPEKFLTWFWWSTF